MYCLVSDVVRMVAKKKKLIRRGILFQMYHICPLVPLEAIRRQSMQLPFLPFGTHTRHSIIRKHIYDHSSKIVEDCGNFMHFLAFSIMDK